MKSIANEINLVITKGGGGKSGKRSAFFFFFTIDSPVLETVEHKSEEKQLKTFN